LTYEILPDSDDEVIGLRLSGLVRAQEHLDTMPEFDKRIGEAKPPGLLLDWTDLEAWDEDAESTALYARILHRSSFTPVAVVAGARWEAET
jgi:hypothetical protein